MKAIADPKRLDSLLNIGLMQIDSTNNPTNIEAFINIGPIAITPTRMTALGPSFGLFPATGSKLLTNVYAIVHNKAVKNGLNISDAKRTANDGRGMSPILFSDGCTNLLRLQPVIIGLETRQ